MNYMKFNHIFKSFLNLNLKPQSLKLLFFLLLPSLTFAQDWKLSYTQPASEWNQALPVGNGRLGAMIFGDPFHEQIVLNDITMWSGSKQDADNPDAASWLPEIRQLLFENRNKEAEKLTEEHFVCKGAGSGYGSGANIPYGSYQVLGTLSLDFDYGPDTAVISTYGRELDLNHAIYYNHFEVNGVMYERKVIACFGDDVIAIQLKCLKPGTLNFIASLSRPERATVESSPKELRMYGRLNNGTDGNGMRYFTCMKAFNDGGNMEFADGRMKVTGAERVVIIISSATDFYKGDDYIDFASDQADIALNKRFTDHLVEHMKAYQNYFDRVSLDFGEIYPGKVPTDHRLADLANGLNDEYLPALYFHYGRYLLICSSRPGLLPANLQGLWTKDIQTPWNGDYHLNINVQMNYWPAEVCQLPEIHQPLLQYIGNLVEPGRKTARAYYNADGWVAHTISNVWGYTSPGEHPSWGAFMGASGWLCEHLWEHYAFTLDTNYLRQAYAVMKESARFYADVLIKDPKTGWLVTAPSNSPENSFIMPDGTVASVCMGPTMDIEIIRELFSNTMTAADILGLDKTFCDTLQAMLSKLPPIRIGKNGQIMEWLEDYDENEVHHRHVSPLYGLHPANQISVYRTPELAEAARVTLERRGDESTGWSMAWKINFWARLGDGNHAYKLYKDLLTPISSANYTFNYTTGGGTYINLLDTHPPFQIDGNFGGCAAVTEMLLQSQDGFIHLLPALPDAWGTGHFDGLVARGGFIVGVDWKGKKVQEVRIRATKANTLVLMDPFEGNFEMMKNGVKEKASVIKMITIPLEAGDQLVFQSIP